MRKLLTLLFVTMISTVVFAGGSIFSGSKTRKNNPNGVDTIGVYICKGLRCPKINIYDFKCSKFPGMVRKYGVCMCDTGYVMKNGECVIDETATCAAINSCEVGYFCNFGGEGTPNVCQKVQAETFEYDGTTYYYNRRTDLSSWCRSTENSNDCAYGFLTYYGAYDWCLTQGARLLKSEEVPTLAQQWSEKLPWNGNLNAYWLDDGRILADGTLVPLGDTTGWEGAGGVVCIKDNTFNQTSSESASGGGWLDIEGCDCNDNGSSTDTTDDLCNIQCCRNKYGADGYSMKGVCCKKNDDECICNARCPGKNCVTGDESTPLDDYCRSWFLGLV